MAVNMMGDENMTVAQNTTIVGNVEVITIDDGEEVDIHPEPDQGIVTECVTNPAVDTEGIGAHDVRAEEDALPEPQVEVKACQSLVLSSESFECLICFSETPPGSGVVLAGCRHTFCRECLTSLVSHCDDVEVRCPFASVEFGACPGELLDAEIRALASQEVLARRTLRSLRRAGLDLATGELWPSLTETVKRALVPNAVRFECPLCFDGVPPGGGVMLKECLHAYCRPCLAGVAEASRIDPIPCPCPSSDYTCDGYLLQEEVRALLGRQAFQRYLAGTDEQASRDRSARQIWTRLEAAGQQDLAPNADVFDCAICFCEVAAGAGVVLKECLHSFCRDCLAGLVQHCEEPEVACPFVSAEYSCRSTLTEKEIRALVSADVYERHLARSLNQAEGKAANSFHCRTPGCAGWCVLEDTVNAFCCPVCSRVSCISCRAIHEGDDCAQYQRRVREEARHNEEARQTQHYLDGMVATRKAIRCPVCAIVLMKKDGCDWVRCPACRSEVCWVTAQPRWGPRGVGDTSGGCRCRVGGRLCHPECRNCH